MAPSFRWVRPGPNDCQRVDIAGRRQRSGSSSRWAVSEWVGSSVSGRDARSSTTSGSGEHETGPRTSIIGSRDVAKRRPLVTPTALSMSEIGSGSAGLADALHECGECFGQVVWVSAHWHVTGVEDGASVDVGT